MGFEELSDEELVNRIHAQESEAMDYLIDKYRNLVKRETREVYIIGADNEDLVQEGMIGLFKAIRDYDETKSASFYTFASLCIKRQIYTAVTLSNRKKHSPLNNYISFYSDEDDSENTIMKNLATDENNPESTVLEQERMGGLMDKIEHLLSKYEKNVLALYLDGLSYTEIARKMERSEKSVDNAIQRIRKKLSE